MWRAPQSIGPLGLCAERAARQSQRPGGSALPHGDTALATVAHQLAARAQAHPSGAAASKRIAAPCTGAMGVPGAGSTSASGSGGIQAYYASKIDELEVIVREKTQNLRRLEAQRNELNKLLPTMLCLAHHHCTFQLKSITNSSDMPVTLEGAIVDTIVFNTEGKIVAMKSEFDPKHFYVQGKNLTKASNDDAKAIMSA